MGYRKIPTIHTLDKIPGEDGLVVRMRGIKVGKLRRLVSSEGDNVEEVLSLILDGLVSWNLEDENGIPVPTTMEGLEDQEMDLITGIIEAWTESVTGVPEELGKGSGSGAISPVALPTMETL